jgi:hypothetical protein
VSTLPALARIVAVAFAAACVAFAIRKLVVEPDAVGMLCEAATPPAWCLARHAVVLGFAFNVYGWTSVVGAIAAALVRRRSLAWLALSAGMFGCVLYRFDPAGAGVLLAALVLARLGARRAEEGQPQNEA